MNPQTPESELKTAEGIESILLDLYHHIETVEGAKRRIQVSMIRQMDDCYSRGHQPDDIPKEVFAYNEGVHECINIINTL